MDAKSDTPDARVAQIAASQHGVLTRRQLEEAGLGSKACGIHLHSTYRHRIPVTSIQRTIDDLDGTVAPYLLRRAKRQAELKRVRLKGAEGTRSRSDLEEDFLALLRRHHQIPAPETNVKLGRWEVDFLWRDKNVVVETDSFTYHQGSVAFGDDHARELDLRQRGFTVLRFTDRQIDEEPTRVVADVARALSA